jgi:hypothetical protein
MRRNKDFRLDRFSSSFLSFRGVLILWEYLEIRG